MDSTSSPDHPTRIAARTSVIDSLKGCGLSGVRIDKEELHRKLAMPKYLRIALRDAISSKDSSTNSRTGVGFSPEENQDALPPEAPLVVFINSKSGGRHGPELKLRMQQIIAEEQVGHLARSLFLSFV
ncbi:hypothetical protein MLD38_014912 [Melastoma candidum]|uniref:Uncharacterized protein n=1 Tax=Melastoma candidum TaxID=119954 RepID=A0ACB9RFP4_9MYRT|nr:hypothetical protein MLD38_014912 [Melastoma candidum]